MEVNFNNNGNAEIQRYYVNNKKHPPMLDNLLHLLVSSQLVSCLLILLKHFLRKRSNAVLEAWSCYLNIICQVVC